MAENKLSKEQQATVDRIFKTFTLETVPDAVVALDNHYTIIYMNKAAELLYGWKKNEVLRKTDRAVMKTRFLASTVEEYRRALKNKGLWVGEAVQFNKNGSRVFVLSAISVVKNEHGAIIGTVAVNRNITEHKQNEYNLKFLSSSAKALSTSLNYEVTLNRVAQLAVPRIADWCGIELLNEKNEIEQVALAHRDPDKVKWAQQLRRRYPPSLEEETGIAKVLKTGKPEFYPYLPDELLAKSINDPKQLALLRKIGMESVMIVPIHHDGTTIGAISMISSESRRHFTDADLLMAEKLASRAALAIQNASLYKNAEREIAERRQTQERLRASEHRLDIILKNVADGITMQNPEGKIVYANDIAAHSLGFSNSHEMINAAPKELSQKYSQFEILDEKGAPVSFFDLPGRRALRGEEAPELVLQFRNKITGELRWSKVKARAVVNEKGLIDYTVNIISDITEQKELESRKDNFISMASHELKTPITTLKIYTDLLTRQLAESNSDKYQKPLEMMTGQINKLSTLIADLLNLSKIQAGKLEFRMQSFNLNDLVCNIVDQLQPTIKHTITVTGEIPISVTGDPERIGQVLINLITNAAKYSPESDKIRITVKNELKEAVVSVKDFGIGIEKQHRKKIFERFYQVSDKTKTFPGLGMGLYISQEIIHRHGGALWVDSIRGKGSTFSFSLPLHQQKNTSKKIGEIKSKTASH